MLFYAKCINFNKYRYSYGRQANKTLKDIELPNKIPDWVYNYQINNDKIKTKIKKCLLNIDTSKWREFNLNDLFKPYLAKAHHKNNITLLKKGYSYITRTGVNNGINGYVNKTSYKFENSNAITIGAEGVVFYYQNSNFICGNRISVLRNENINKYNALFIITVLNFKLKDKYNYGRAIVLNKLKKMNIPFPVTLTNNPDWEFMENYIKSLPYSDNI